MIENYNESKNPIEGEIVDYKKYIGVGSVNIIAVNPNNETLRKYGWNIPEDADEQKYIYTKERDGKQVSSTKIRLLAEVQDLEDKPIIPMDFWISNEVVQNADRTKAQIIDSFGRTAWGNIQDEIKPHKIPQYSSGPANISKDYMLCHRGEEALVKFIFKYLNITPLQRFDRVANGYVDSKNPGKFRFDNWAKLCANDVTELREYLKLQPENRVKVVFGVSTTDDNRTYQTFLNTNFFGNALKPDIASGEYKAAKTAIDKYMERRTLSNETFTATPIHLWSQTATENIQDNSSSMFDESGNFIDDLPM